MGLLDGLGLSGLKKLEKINIFEEPEKEKDKEAVKAAPVIRETDFLFDKSYDCPVCDSKIKARTLRAGRARLVRSDMDLRPIYENIEPLKYDPVVCPKCGYSALARYFSTILSSQVKEVRENICQSFQGNLPEQETYSYEDALYRYKLCLANAVVKRAKASEKAYICLKAGWLLRSWQESLKASEEEADPKKLEELKEQEQEFLKSAMEGFFAAREAEGYPMCGMDETTVDYLSAVLAMEYGQLDVASRIISSIITSPSANARMKDRARDVKEMILTKIKEKNAK